MYWVGQGGVVYLYNRRELQKEEVRREEHLSPNNSLFLLITIMLSRIVGESNKERCWQGLSFLIYNLKSNR